jgi:hypothetical protein
MLSLIRPSFEVVKEGRIFHFVSGERRFILSSKQVDIIILQPNATSLILVHSGQFRDILSG